jgi:hypothetical protein
MTPTLTPQRRPSGYPGGVPPTLDTDRTVVLPPKAPMAVRPVQPGSGHWVGWATPAPRHPYPGQIAAPAIHPGWAPPAPSRSRLSTNWLLAAGTAAAITAVAVALVVSTSSDAGSARSAGPSAVGVPVPTLPTKSPRPSTPSVPAPPATVDDAALAALLPDAQAISQIMGSAGMTEVPDLTGPTLFTDTADPAQCLGAVVPGARGAYAGAPWRAAYSQTVHDAATGGAPHLVFTAVTTFPTAATAANFAAQQLPVWQGCQPGPITTNPGDNPMTWTTEGVAQHGPSLVAFVHPQGSDVTCQRALTAVQNVVIDVQACSVGATNQAETITAAISQHISG